MEFGKGDPCSFIRRTNSFSQSSMSQQQRTHVGLLRSTTTASLEVPTASAGGIIAGANTRPGSRLKQVTFAPEVEENEDDEEMSVEQCSTDLDDTTGEDTETEDVSDGGASSCSMEDSFSSSSGSPPESPYKGMAVDECSPVRVTSVRRAQSMIMPKALNFSAWEGLGQATLSQPPAPAAPALPQPFMFQQPQPLQLQQQPQPQQSQMLPPQPIFSFGAQPAICQPEVQPASVARMILKRSDMGCDYGQRSLPNSYTEPGPLTTRARSSSSAGLPMPIIPDVPRDTEKVKLATKSLPLVPKTNLPSIDHQTLVDLMKGKYGNKISSYVVVDMRYRPEFNGGHIKGAINVDSNEDVEARLRSIFFSHTQVRTPQTAKMAIIFHCEFSSRRAPKAMEIFHTMDDKLAKGRVPERVYPETYLLHGGYSVFFANQADYCNPRSYLKEVDIPKGEIVKPIMDPKKVQARQALNQTSPTCSMTNKLRRANSEASTLMVSKPKSLFSFVPAADKENLFHAN